VIYLKRFQIETGGVNMPESKTIKNLETAFAGESQANRKYLAFAKKADEEGYHQEARFFRAAAEAETIHAHTHLKSMGKIRSTEENLQAAVAGETYEFTSMYPSFIEDARTEGDSQAERAFRLASEAEKVHAEMYSKLLTNLGKNPDLDYFLCTVCGHIAEENAPEACPLCGAKKPAYKPVN
jgi:rubrerythrin